MPCVLSQASRDLHVLPPPPHPPHPTQCDAPTHLTGSIEGRVAVHHVEDAVGAQRNFTFKCHRDASDIYAVNAIEFHPVHGTFVTAGSDGNYNFWDKVCACGVHVRLCVHWRQGATCA